MPGPVLNTAKKLLPDVLRWSGSVVTTAIKCSCGKRGVILRERNIEILMYSGYGQQVQGHVPFIVQKITWIDRLGAESLPTQYQVTAG